MSETSLNQTNGESRVNKHGRAASTRTVKRRLPTADIGRCYYIGVELLTPAILRRALGPQKARIRSAREVRPSRHSGMRTEAITISFASVALLLAQDAAIRPIYRLSFSVTERDDQRLVKERKYAVVVADQDSGRIHAGVRIPYMPSEGHLNMAAIGVIIDCKVRTVQPAVNVDCSLENSSVADKQPNLPPGYPPVISTIQSHVSTVLR